MVETVETVTEPVRAVRGTVEFSAGATQDGESSVVSAARPTRRPAVFSRRWAAILLGSDLFCFSAAAVISMALILHNETFGTAAGTFFHTSFLCIVIWLFAFEHFGLYRSSFALSAKDELYYTLAALSVGIIPQIGLFPLVHGIATSRWVLVLTIVFSTVLVSLSRAGLHYVRTREALRKPMRIAIVGTRGRIASAVDLLNLPEGTEILRLAVDSIERTIENFSPHNSAPMEEIPWFARARSWRCNRLILTEILPPHLLPNLIAATAGQFNVEFALPRVVSHAYSLTLRTEGQLALVVPAPLRACTFVARTVKRTFDVIIAFLAFIAFAPLMLLTALAISLEDGGPVFYRQERVGRSGKTFDILKFRSMRKDAEAASGPTWVRAEDDRITRVGKFIRATSLDELPQLMNVLAGDMSIVGPRPERPHFVQLFRRELPRYDERHLVRPGITGWSQMHMRRQLDTDEIGQKLSYDLFYVENWSFFMDISLVFRTAFEVLFQRAR